MLRFFPKPRSNYTNTQQGISAPPSTSLSPLLLWCYGQQGPLHRVALMSKRRVCVLLILFFFYITVKSVFVCRANMDRKHRLTPPCEHTPTFQPEQSRIKRRSLCCTGESRLLPRPPHPTSSPSDSSLPTNILQPCCMQTGKNTAVGMQLQVLIGAIFFFVVKMRVDMQRCRLVADRRGRLTCTRCVFHGQPDVISSLQNLGRQTLDERSAPAAAGFGKSHWKLPPEFPEPSRD